MKLIFGDDDDDDDDDDDENDEVDENNENDEDDEDDETFIKDETLRREAQEKVEK